jgi:CRISPR-associated protein Cas8c/Csd1 subtype I-C
MILQALKEYGDSESVKPQGEEGINSNAFADNVAIHWLLEIDRDGRFVNLHYRGIEQRDEKGKKKPDRFAPLHRVPREVINARSSGGNPQFLADNLEYYFGISDSDLGAKNCDSHMARANEFAESFPNCKHSQAIKKFFQKCVAGRTIAQQQEKALDRVNRFFAGQPSSDILSNRQTRVLKRVEQYFAGKLSDTVQVVWKANPARGESKFTINARPFSVKKPKERIAICLQEDSLLPAFQACVEVRRYWSEHFSKINAQRQAAPAGDGNPPCICCGQSKPAVSTFDQFEGLPGGKTFLICYGKDAFHSYHFDNGENASLCYDCMKAAMRGIEALLRNPATHYLVRAGKPKPGEADAVAPVMFTFWSRETSAFDFGKINEADPQSVKDLLESVRRGIPKEIAERRFYILGFSRSSRLRTLIRYWTETNIENVAQNLKAWFEDLKDRFGEYGPNYKPLPLVRLCQMTVRQPGQPGDEWKFPPVVSSSLFLSAFLGKPVPPPVLQMLVNRVRIIPQADFEKENPTADYKLKPARMALLRLTLNRLMKNNEPQFNPGLDVGREEPEYHCGRLLAVCDDAMRWSTSSQRGKPGKSTVADRYMGSASSTPCNVLPVVYRNSRHHLNKLKRDLPTKSLQLERLLDEILSKLKTYPVTLTPQQAGVFILGFHHQRQYFFLISRYAKLKKQRDEGALSDESKKELSALEDFVNRARFDVSLLADLPDEEAPEVPSAESE